MSDYIPRIILLLVLFLFVTGFSESGLNEHVARNRDILALAPLIPDLIQSKYSDGKEWKRMVQKELVGKDAHVDMTRLGTLKEFQSKVTRMGEWLKQVGINDPGSTVFTQELHNSLGSGNYLRMKSGEWVCANLMSLSKIRPTHIVDIHYWGTDLEEYVQDIYSRGGRNFYLTEDASYSGSQLRYMLNRLNTVLADDQKKQVKLYLAVPFMSTIAKKHIDDGKFRFDIIFYPNMAEMPLYPGYYKCLFAFEHKIPDHISVPKWLENALDVVAKRMYGTIAPPYRCEVNVLISMGLGMFPIFGSMKPPPFQTLHEGIEANLKTPVPNQVVSTHVQLRDKRDCPPVRVESEKDFKVRLKDLTELLKQVGINGKGSAVMIADSSALRDDSGNWILDVMFDSRDIHPPTAITLENLKPGMKRTGNEKNQKLFILDGSSLSEDILKKLEASPINHETKLYLGYLYLSHRLESAIKNSKFPFKIIPYPGHKVQPVLTPDCLEEQANQISKFVGLQGQGLGDLFPIVKNGKTHFKKPRAYPEPMHPSGHISSKVKSVTKANLPRYGPILPIPLRTVLQVKHPRPIAPPNPVIRIA